MSRPVGTKSTQKFKKKAYNEQVTGRVNNIGIMVESSDSEYLAQHGRLSEMNPTRTFFQWDSPLRKSSAKDDSKRWGF
jgi:hypothetical protein